MKRRKQPVGLARAREQRKRDELDERAVVALERIAAAFEGFPDRFAIFLQRATVPIERKRSRVSTCEHNVPGCTPAVPCALCYDAAEGVSRAT